MREGLTMADDALPSRLTETPQPASNDDKAAGPVVPLEKMLKQYYKVRGWDAKGVPTAKKLKQLKIKGA
jgi:aldehyde:ferredoxin oxidoreductase